MSTSCSWVKKEGVKTQNESALLCPKPLTEKDLPFDDYLKMAKINEDAMIKIAIQQEQLRICRE